MDRKKIILCYPPINRYRNERPWHWFPFSVLPLAQKLVRHGYHPIVLDFRMDSNAYRKLKRNAHDALAIGISAMSGYQIAGGLRIARIVREVNPKIPIIWGGWHSTILPEETAEHPLVDIAVAGKGEETLVELLDAIKNNKKIDNIKAVAFKKGKGIGFTGRKIFSCIEDDAQQYEKFINIQSYINPETRAFGYFTGNGCVFNCAFCSRNFMLKGYVSLPVTKVIEDVSYFINKYGFKRIQFQDDNFFLDRNRVLEIADKLVGKSITWWANIRANVIQAYTKEQIEVLVASGMDTLFIGVESASQGLLNLLNKETNVEDIMRTNDILKHYNVVLQLSYILGIPGDGLENLRLIIKQLKDIKQQNKHIKIQTCFYQPYPKTVLYQKALEAGYPKVAGLESWSRIKSQTDFIEFPWLNKKEVDQYKKEFTAFFNEHEQ